MDPVSGGKVPLILASVSPRRASLLRQAGVRFTVVHSYAPEIHLEGLTACELAQVNAYRKSCTVAANHPDALVLGADTLVYLGTRLFGKPTNLADARRMLQELQGRTHEVVSAVCLLHLRAGRCRVFKEVTAVTFRPLGSAGIRRYLAQVNPLDKAGAYAIQEQGDLIIREIVGSYTNVVGLPLERVRTELNRWWGTL